MGSAATPGPDLAVGAVAPAFDLESGGGFRVKLADYRGKTSVVVYFMREFT